VPFDRLTLEEEKKIIDQAKESGARTVLICGDGEPLLDPQLAPIVRYVHDKGMRTVIFTNGSILGDDPLSGQIHKMSGYTTGPIPL